LLESMRAVGYSFEAALADLIDNSITAGARAINVRFSVAAEPYVAIIDDGCGMSGSVLTAAMRHGSRNPALQREAMDLGRLASASRPRRSLSVVPPRSSRGATVS
jgi:hypothetical protein